MPPSYVSTSSSWWSNHTDARTRSGSTRASPSSCNISPSGSNVYGHAAMSPSPISNETSQQRFSPQKNVARLHTTPSYLQRLMHYRSSHESHSTNSPDSPRPMRFTNESPSMGPQTNYQNLRDFRFPAVPALAQSSPPPPPPPPLTPSKASLSSSLSSPYPNAYANPNADPNHFPGLDPNSPPISPTDLVGLWSQAVSLERSNKPSNARLLFTHLLARRGVPAHLVPLLPLNAALLMLSYEAAPLPTLHTLHVTASQLCPRGGPLFTLATFLMGVAAWDVAVARGTAATTMPAEVPASASPAAAGAGDENGENHDQDGRETIDCLAKAKAFFEASLAEMTRGSGGSGGSGDDDDGVWNITLDFAALGLRWRLDARTVQRNAALCDHAGAALNLTVEGRQRGAWVGIVPAPHRVPAGLLFWPPEFGSGVVVQPLSMSPSDGREFWGPLVDWESTGKEWKSAGIVADEGLPRSSEARYYGGRARVQKGGYGLMKELPPVPQTDW